MPSAVEIFICYAREDEALLEDLKKHLSILQRRELIRVWHDRDISAGKEWEDEINFHLNAAQIILLLISPDFMKSDYCYSKEMMQALERHRAKEACVIPVILRSTLWEESPLGKLQALPTDGKPVLSIHWRYSDDAFFDVTMGIRKAIDELITRPLASSSVLQQEDGPTPETAKDEQQTQDPVQQLLKPQKSPRSTQAFLEDFLKSDPDYHSLNGTYNLFVITVGTIAGEVGLALLRQIQGHPASQLSLIVRHIEAAYGPSGRLGGSKWFPLTINPQLVDIISGISEEDSHLYYPHLSDLLFPDLMPGIRASSSRYNAAVALAINDGKLGAWLTMNIYDLIMDDIRNSMRDTDHLPFSVALVVSAMEAAGSGTLEGLIKMIAYSAHAANFPIPLHYNVFILQPDRESSSDLDLANTLALYAEMAASRLAEHNLGNIRTTHIGRTIIVGWDNEHHLTSIDQLQETTATLIRLTHDPATHIAPLFQERGVDNHVLREFDILTGLPSHLSSATTATISLGDLEEQVLWRDAAHLLDMVVFGGKAPENLSKEYSFAGRSDYQPSPLLKVLTDFLQGDTLQERCVHLMRSLTEPIHIPSLRINSVQMQGLTVQQQANRLRSMWQNDKEEIIKNGRIKMQEQGAQLAAALLNDLIQLRQQWYRTTTKFTLHALADEYQLMRNVITSILSLDIEQVENILGYQIVNLKSEEVLSKIHEMERSAGFRFRKEQNLQQALKSVQMHIKGVLACESYSAAIEVLIALQKHCDEFLDDLKVGLQRLLNERKNTPEWAAADQDFQIDSRHPLSILAFSTDEEIAYFANLMSIFPPRRREARSTIGRLSSSPLEELELRASFHQWLSELTKLDTFLEGNVEVMLELAQEFVRQQMYRKVPEHSILDVLLQAGEPVLQQRLREAAAAAQPLVRFSDQLANELREQWLVSTCWRSAEQQDILKRAITRIFGSRRCTLIPSEDPTEIVIFYFVDGLPMSAVTDLTGRCLDAFLKQRSMCQQQVKLGEQVSNPIYSGNSAMQRVLDTGVIRKLYKVRGQEVTTYTKDEIAELADYEYPTYDMENT